MPQGGVADGVRGATSWEQANVPIGRNPREIIDGGYNGEPTWPFATRNTRSEAAKIAASRYSTRGRHVLAKGPALMTSFLDSRVRVLAMDSFLDYNR